MKLMYNYDGDDWFGIVCGAATVTLYGIVQHPGEDLATLFSMQYMLVAFLKFAGMAIAGGFLGKLGKDLCEQCYKGVKRLFTHKTK